MGLARLSWLRLGRLWRQDDVGTAFARFLDVHHVLDAEKRGLARIGNDAGVRGVLKRHNAKTSNLKRARATSQMLNCQRSSPFIIEVFTDEASVAVMRSGLRT